MPNLTISKNLKSVSYFHRKGRGIALLPVTKMNIKLDRQIGQKGIEPFVAFRRIFKNGCARQGKRNER